MQLEIRNNRDVWAGVMLIVTGAAAVIIARDYAFGTALRMGPGYFPSVLGGLLVLFGLYLVAQGLRSNEQIEVSINAAGIDETLAVRSQTREEFSPRLIGKLNVSGA